MDSQSISTGVSGGHGPHPSAPKGKLLRCVRWLIGRNGRLAHLATSAFYCFRKSRFPIYLTHIHRQVGPYRPTSPRRVPPRCGTHGGVYLVDVHLTYTGVHLAHKRVPYGRADARSPICAAHNAVPHWPGRYRHLQRVQMLIVDLHPNAPATASASVSITRCLTAALGLSVQ